MQHRLVAAARKLNTSENWNRFAIVVSIVVIAFAMMTLVHVPKRRLYRAQGGAGP